MIISKCLKFKQVLQVNKIENLLHNLIKHTGPLTLFNFMKEVLSNSSNGYYMNKDVFGVQGDFITSPEISQMFGELCGIWIVNEWILQGCPKPFQIIEFGPGRGSLMNDAINAIAKFPALLSEVVVSFVEISPVLRVIQANTMKNCVSRIGVDIPIKWFNDINLVPRGMPSVYLAHEFMDALPVHKFKKNSEGKWREILVDLIRTNNDIEMGFVISDKETAATVAFAEILECNSHLNDMEINPISATIIEQIGERILDSGGFCLIADYGHNGDKGDTFRAFKCHQVTDPLKNVGESDLTADVDFKFLVDRLSARFSRKLLVNGPIRQRDFLRNMGIDTRLQMLLGNCKTKLAVDHLLSGYNVMMSPDQMGDRFKFLSILPANMSYPMNYVPAGFCVL